MKEELNKERGITLVALIITIIVLVILAAVTIKAAFQDGFLDLAARATENYSMAQVKEQNKMKEIENLFKDVQKEYGDLVSPEISIEGELNNDTYKGIVTVKINDKLNENSSKAEKIKYVINGEEKYLNGTNNSFTVEGDGTYEIVAYMVDKNNNLSLPSETKIFTIKNNTAPRWAEGGEPHSVEERKTDTQIRISMTAVDDDGDNLTYTIKYYTCNEDGTKGDYIGEKKIEDVPQEEEQIVDITGLTINTKYYFEVSVSDGKSNEKISILDVYTSENKHSIESKLVQQVDLTCNRCNNKYNCPKGRRILPFYIKHSECIQVIKV